jgi:methylenetetrahydrofolate dehydrogenase (NADP+)/methenyltetrahydrofolate cyclohydrolase
VSVVEKGGDVGAATHEADIVVLGVGHPGLLTPDMVKDGVIILDAGTSESSGKVVGDADPMCAEKASLFTPVPGGVGPIAVTEIFANLFDLLKKSA